MTDPRGGESIPNSNTEVLGDRPRSPAAGEEQMDLGNPTLASRDEGSSETLNDATQTMMAESAAKETEAREKRPDGNGSSQGTAQEANHPTPTMADGPRTSTTSCGNSTPSTRMNEGGASGTVPPPEMIEDFPIKQEVVEVSEQGSSEELYWKCNICDAKFPSLAAVEEHAIRVHNVSNPIFEINPIRTMKSEPLGEISNGETSSTSHSNEMPNFELSQNNESSGSSSAGTSSTTRVAGTLAEKDVGQLATRDGARQVTRRVSPQTTGEVRKPAKRHRSASPSRCIEVRPTNEDFMMFARKDKDKEKQASGSGEAQATGGGETLPTSGAEPQASGDDEPQASGDVEPQATGGDEPQASGDVETQAFGDVEPQAFGDVEPQATGGDAPQATGGDAPQATGVDEPQATTSGEKTPPKKLFGTARRGKGIKGPGFRTLSEKYPGFCFVRISALDRIETQLTRGRGAGRARQGRARAGSPATEARVTRSVTASLVRLTRSRSRSQAQAQSQALTHTRGHSTQGRGRGAPQPARSRAATQPPSDESTQVTRGRGLRGRGARGRGTGGTRGRGAGGTRGRGAGGTRGRGTAVTRGGSTSSTRRGRRRQNFSPHSSQSKSKRNCP